MDRKKGNKTVDEWEKKAKKAIIQEAIKPSCRNKETRFERENYVWWDQEAIGERKNKQETEEVKKTVGKRRGTTQVQLAAKSIRGICVKKVTQRLMNKKTAKWESTGRET